MAREKSLADEIREARAKFEEQMAGKIETAAEKIREQLSEAKKKVRELESELSDITGKKTKGGGERAPKRCSICVGQGKSGTGHTKRTHQQWLKDQKD